MRDVLVNVVANLVAAGILYLLGVGVGLFPSNRSTILGAVGFLVSIVAPGISGSSFDKWDAAEGARGRRIRWGVLCVGAGLATVGGLAAVFLGLDRVALAVAVLVVLILLIVGALVWFFVGLASSVERGVRL
jgi:hypothetical protein